MCCEQLYLGVGLKKGWLEEGLRRVGGRSAMYR